MFFYPKYYCFLYIFCHFHGFISETIYLVFCVFSPNYVYFVLFYPIFISFKTRRVPFCIISFFLIPRYSYFVGPFAQLFHIYILFIHFSSNYARSRSTYTFYNIYSFIPCFLVDFVIIVDYLFFLVLRYRAMPLFARFYIFS